MIVSRRGFLKTILAVAAAPAIVHADSLMRVRPLYPPDITLEWWTSRNLIDELRVTKGHIRYFTQRDLPPAPINDWTHIAIVRKDGKLISYIDTTESGKDPTILIEAFELQKYLT